MFIGAVDKVFRTVAFVALVLGGAILFTPTLTILQKFLDLLSERWRVELVFSAPGLFWIGLVYFLWSMWLNLAFDIKGRFNSIDRYTTHAINSAERTILEHSRELEERARELRALQDKLRELQQRLSELEDRDCDEEDDEEP